MYNLKLNFVLENNIIPNDINRTFVSYMKKTLETFDKKIYDKLYQTNNIETKKYTFCTKMQSLKFEKGFIYLANKVLSVELTDCDLSELIAFYNAFLKQKSSQQKYSMYNNSMLLTHVYLNPMQLSQDNEVIIKMESPLVVRFHHDDKDEYLSVQDDRFEELLNIVTKNMLTSLGYDATNIHISPIKGKKTVMNLYKHKADCSLGYFKIFGDPYLILVLLQTGIGSRRSIGAGKFKIVG